MWVAEAGTGAVTSNSCFDSAEGPACTGASGAITRINRWGQKRVVTGLASFAGKEGDSAIGPHGIFADGNDIYFTNGGPTGPTRGGPTNIVLRDPTLVSEEPVSRFYGTLRKVTRHGGHFKIADLWKFEAENNPDAGEGNPLIDSNPVDVYADHGHFFVADAGGNSVLRVGAFGGISPVKIFPIDDVPTRRRRRRDHPDAGVPAAWSEGPDGALYLSQLTGFPFPAGGAKVFRIDPRTGKKSEYATGFTNIIDLDFGRDGTLYVLEIDADSLLGGSTDGALFKVPWRGKPKQVALPAGTLTHPGGVAVGKRGDLRDRSLRPVG